MNSVPPNRLKSPKKRFLLGALSLGLALSGAHASTEVPEPKNAIFILIDDLRWDCLGYMGHPFVETPNIDRLAKEGVHFQNAFVTTSLCSPSRASILTGKYMHNHLVGDNQTAVVPRNRLFPEDLQQSGYETAFIGKWHMGGHSSAPRPGFDHWVSFHGQGTYFPSDNSPININGTEVPHEKYMTDELTEYAVEWLDKREQSKPFFLYLSHKGVHGLYDPAPRHLDRYIDKEVPVPVTMADTEENYQTKPKWVRDQRNSWHGVDFPYHGGANESMEEMYRHYCEMILSIDDSVGEVIETLEEKGLAENTLVVFMGDNGFYWGEHGLIDKRSAYEESMRVPLIAWGPGFIESGAIDQVVANIDIAPTILDYLGAETTIEMDGRSFWPLLQGRPPQEPWRDYLLYEYYWEFSFPQTPTTFALRGNRFKYIQYHGIWDIDELYDLQNDPLEQHNLFSDPEHEDTVKQMRETLYQKLKQTGGLSIPISHQTGYGRNKRHPDGNRATDFPPQFYVE